MPKDKQVPETHYATRIPNGPTPKGRWLTVAVPIVAGELVEEGYPESGTLCVTNCRVRLAPGFSKVVAPSVPNQLSFFF